MNQLFTLQLKVNVDLLLFPSVAPLILQCFFFLELYLLILCSGPLGINPELKNQSIAYTITPMCSFCWQKCGLRPKLFLPLKIFSTFRGVHTLIFTYVPYIAIGLHEEPANIYGETREWAGSQGPLICHVIYYKSSFKIFDFFFLPFKYPWLRSHDFMYIFKSGKSVCVTVCRSGYQCVIILGPVYMEVGDPR